MRIYVVCVWASASIWIRFVICKKEREPEQLKHNNKYVCGGYLISETAYAKFLTLLFTITLTLTLARTPYNISARWWMERRKKIICTAATFYFQTNERQLMLKCMSVCVRLLFAHFVPLAYCTISLVHIICVSLSLSFLAISFSSSVFLVSYLPFRPASIEYKYSLSFFCFLFSPLYIYVDTYT